jgi:hypothetical protein
VDAPYDLVMTQPHSRRAFLQAFQTQGTMAPSSNHRVRVLARAEFCCRRGPKHNSSKPAAPLQRHSALKQGCVGRLRLSILAANPNVVRVEEAGGHSCTQEKLQLAPRK